MIKNDAVAFAMPGGEVCRPAGARPIDLTHLARQTMGDRDLEREILQMFVEQAASMCERMVAADTAQRLFLAHALKGAARGVGAMEVAEYAAAIETSPEDDEALRRLAGSVDAARDFVAAVNR